MSTLFMAFLPHRFGPSTKSAAAGMFLLGRVFAGGSRLFIASLAVKVALGLPMAHSIIALGAIAVVYTLFGGIKAVIWTDVMQAIVLIGWSSRDHFHAHEASATIWFRGW